MLGFLGRLGLSVRSASRNASRSASRSAFSVRPKVALSLVAVFVLTRGVAAQEGPSQQQIAAGNELLQAGKVAYSEGRYADALNDFEQAYQRLQRPSVLYRIGDAADKLGEHERAVSALREYLDSAADTPDRAFIESRIEANLAAQREPVPAKAISPEAAAAGSAAAPDAATAPDGATRGGHGNAGPWWLWVGAGTVAVAGIVVAAILVGSGSPSERPPVEGNVAGVVQTLGAP